LIAQCAPESVQTGFPLVLKRVFDLPAIHFHTVFNKTVEIFNTSFTFDGAGQNRMVNDLQ